MDFLKQHLLNRRGASRAFYALAAIFFIAGLCSISNDIPVTEETAIKTMESAVNSAKEQLKNTREQLKNSESENSGWLREDVEARRKTIAVLDNELARMNSSAALSRKRAGAAVAQYYVLSAAFLLACGYIAGKPVK